MAQFDKTFPTLDCAACILTPKMVDAGAHPNITLLSYSEVERVDGYVGNFTVTIRKKARYVDEDVCTGCGICIEKCPVKVIDMDLKRVWGIARLYIGRSPRPCPSTQLLTRKIAPTSNAASVRHARFSAPRSPTQSTLSSKTNCCRFPWAILFWQQGMICLMPAAFRSMDTAVLPMFSPAWNSSAFVMHPVPQMAKLSYVMA